MEHHGRAECHKTEYEQYLRSRHAAPAWAAVAGDGDFTEVQIAFAEKYHEGTIKRPQNKLSLLEGPAAIKTGCLNCHDVGRPNLDGSIGTCTDCHARHSTSIYLARQPETCGQCHTRRPIDEYYAESEAVVQATNAKVQDNLKRLVDASPEVSDGGLEYRIIPLYLVKGSLARGE